MSRFLSAILSVLLLGLLAACGATPNVVTWDTASEVNTAGFNVYRGVSANGPWTQINETLIPPAADPVQGGHYEFQDTGAAPGETYYYLLEEIELTGASTRYPPTQLEQPGNRTWVLWVVTAGLAVGVGWWLGGRWRTRVRREPLPRAPEEKG